MILSLLATMALAAPCLKPSHHGHHIRKPIACQVTTQIRRPNQATVPILWAVPDTPLDPIPLPAVSYYSAPSDPATPTPFYDTPWISPWSNMDLAGMLFAGVVAPSYTVNVTRSYSNIITYAPNYVTTNNDNAQYVTNVTYNTSTNNYNSSIVINKHPPAAHIQKAPELGQSGLGTSLTLLAGILLVIRARKNL